MQVSRDSGAAGVGEPAPGPRGQAAGGEEPRAGRAGCGPGGLVSWRRRPLRTSAVFAAANAVWWFVAFSPLRAYSLLAVLVAALVVTVTVRDIVQSRFTGARPPWSRTASWDMMDSGPGRRSGTGPQLADALKLFLQETSAFKQQNPGKFCLLVCSLCTFFAVIGRYIPGIVISYVLVLSVFLWPLISSHEVGLWLEPVLQKLDFGVGEFLRKIKENHEKRIVQAQAEKEGIESDLSSMFPKLDSTVCRELSVSDTEASDVTWTDNGTFNLSEGHTPQTENSEDLDREEAFTSGLPEFPSLDNGSTTNGDDNDDLSLGLLLLTPEPQQPIKSKHAPSSHTEQPTDKALDLVQQVAGEFVAAAVTAAIQDRIETAVGFAALSRNPERSGPSGSSRLLELAEESDSEVEDFELLDQSELEQLEGELGLGEKKVQSTEEAQAKIHESASTGFFSKLLRRH